MAADELPPTDRARLREIVADCLDVFQGSVFLPDGTALGGNRLIKFDLVLGKRKDESVDIFTHG